MGDILDAILGKKKEAQKTAPQAPKTPPNPEKIIDMAAPNSLLNETKKNISPKKRMRGLPSDLEG